MSRDIKSEITFDRKGENRINVHSRGECRVNVCTRRVIISDVSESGCVQENDPTLEIDTLDAHIAVHIIGMRRDNGTPADVGIHRWTYATQLVANVHKQCGLRPAL